MSNRFPSDQTPCEGYCWPDGCPPSQPCHAAYMRLSTTDVAGGGSVSTDIDQKRDGALSASPLSDGPTDQPSDVIGAAT